MSNDDEAPVRRENIQKTADGEPLVLRRIGLPPLQYGDTRAYCRLPVDETVLWLLTAAGSGIVGNLAYDALKGLIKKAQTLHRKFSAALVERTESSQRSHHGISKIRPDVELWDDLVEITYDVLARQRHLQHKNSGRPMSEISAFFTKDSTWAVVTRELKSPRFITVEIDLREDVERNRYRAMKEVQGFPVRIWSM